MHTWHSYHSTKAFQIKYIYLPYIPPNTTSPSPQMMEALWNSCSSLPLDYLDLKLLGSQLSAVQRLRGRDTSSGSTRFLQIRTGHAGSTKEFLFNFSCVKFHWFLKGMNLMVGIFFWAKGTFSVTLGPFQSKVARPVPTHCRCCVLRYLQSCGTEMKQLGNLPVVKELWTCWY